MRNVASDDQSQNEIIKNPLGHLKAVMYI